MDAGIVANVVNLVRLYTDSGSDQPSDSGSEPPTPKESEKRKSNESSTHAEVTAAVAAVASTRMELVFSIRSPMSIFTVYDANETNWGEFSEDEPRPSPLSTFCVPSLAFTWKYFSNMSAEGSVQARPENWLELVMGGTHGQKTPVTELSPNIIKFYGQISEAWDRLPTIANTI